MLHATGSSAFTQTLRRVAGSRAPRVQSHVQLLQPVRRRRAEQPRRADLRRGAPHPGDLRQPLHPARLRTGTPQVEELLRAARVPVFLLDEHQVVRPGELGTSRRDHRGGRPARPRRARGRSWTGSSAAAAAGRTRTWVLRLLGLEPGGPAAWEGDEHFDVTVAESPQELEPAARAAGARLQRADQRRLLLAVERRPPGRHPRRRRRHRRLAPALEQQEGHLRRRRARRPFWATDPAGSGRSAASTPRRASSTTGRGDHRARPGVAGRTAGSPSRSAATTPRPSGRRWRIDLAVRNTYKVLLTRGMRGSLSTARTRRRRSCCGRCCATPWRRLGPEAVCRECCPAGRCGRRVQPFLYMWHQSGARSGKCPFPLHSGGRTMAVCATGSVMPVGPVPDASHADDDHPRRGRRGFAASHRRRARAVAHGGPQRRAAARSGPRPARGRTGCQSGNWVCEPEWTSTRP